MATVFYVNGRYLTQTQSGVQRFATEMTIALRQIYADRLVVLGPRGARLHDPRAREVGGRQGQVWEQLELPRHAAGGVLINLGNIAPLRLHAQVVVIHDAGVHATPEAYSWRFRFWYKFAQGGLLRRGARIVTVSQFARTELCRYLGAAPEQIAVVSEGADHMIAVTSDPSVLARVPPGRFVLVVGNLAAHKNLSALSLLAGHLAERGVSLVVTGGLAPGAFRAMGAADLPQPACYIGRVSDGALKALYEAAICLVFPSRYEGFGLPAIEAMACGCPVAAARIPALQEVCADAAIYFDPGSPADIAAQVCRLVDDETTRAQFRAASGPRAAIYTWARAAHQLAAIAEAV